LVFQPLACIKIWVKELSHAAVLLFLPLYCETTETVVVQKRSHMNGDNVKNLILEAGRLSEESGIYDRQN
jgi:hypothetical protein